MLLLYFVAVMRLRACCRSIFTTATWTLDEHLFTEHKRLGETVGGVSLYSQDGVLVHNFSMSMCQKAQPWILLSTEYCPSVIHFVCSHRRLCVFWQPVMFSMIFLKQTFLCPLPVCQIFLLTLWKTNSKRLSFQQCYIINSIKSLKFKSTISKILILWHLWKFTFKNWCKNLYF